MPSKGREAQGIFRAARAPREVVAERSGLHPGAAAGTVWALERQASVGRIASPSYGTVTSRRATGGCRPWFRRVPANA
jgi:hypothetical protein